MQAFPCQCECSLPVDVLARVVNLTVGEAAGIRRYGGGQLVLELAVHKAEARWSEGVEKTVACANPYLRGSLNGIFCTYAQNRKTKSRELLCGMHFNLSVHAVGYSLQAGRPPIELLFLYYALIQV